MELAVPSIRKADDNKQRGEYKVLTPPTTPAFTLKSSPFTQEDSVIDDRLYDDNKWESAYSDEETVAMWDSMIYENLSYEEIDMADAFPMLSAIERKSEYGMDDNDVVQPSSVDGREDSQLDVRGGVEEGGGIEDDGGGQEGGG